MGMGEPLANYLVTMDVVQRLHEYRGLSARHITVSTVGVAPAIERMAKTGLPLTLAVSLHSANNESRSQLIHSIAVIHSNGCTRPVCSG